MRLGGIVHAARGLWAADLPYAVAAICPDYLVEQTKNFLLSHGCSEFFWLGNVFRAPNVIVIGDVREVGHQGYEDILRDERSVALNNIGQSLKPFDRVVIFPGHYDLGEVRNFLSHTAEVTVDVAYDVESMSQIASFRGMMKALVISTSSDLFIKLAKDDLINLITEARKFQPDVILLKENRGGSRLILNDSDEIFHIPATLSETVNSVGVGDAYTAVFAALASRGWEEAAHRGAQVATNYAVTTFPDDLRAGVRRDFKLGLDAVKALGGVVLPWHERPLYQIYLAAPDFSYVQKDEIESAVTALEYHNFTVRRPVVENGEVEQNSPPSTLRKYYQKDVELLDECHIVFAIPIDRDPGTLVEVGIAIARNKPVVMFDARNENSNTMTICGSFTYSLDLDTCLNGVFEAISKLRRSQELVQ